MDDPPFSAADPSKVLPGKIVFVITGIAFVRRSRYFHVGAAIRSPADDLEIWPFAIAEVLRRQGACFQFYDWKATVAIVGIGLQELRQGDFAANRLARKHHQLAGF